MWGKTTPEVAGDQSNRKVAVSQNTAKAVFIFNTPSILRARTLVVVVI